MITIISLTIHSYRLCFLVMRTFNIHPLRNFQICNTPLLMIGTMLYITPPWFIFYWKFVPFDSLPLFGPPPPLPAPGNHQCIHCICVLDEAYVIMSMNPMNPKLAAVHPWNWGAHEGLSPHWLLLKWTQYLQALLTGKQTHLSSKERKVPWS